MKHFPAHAIFLAALLASSTAWAQNVKITPLGSHAGELCTRDRATIFEDPTGVRILYDAGQSVTGADDPRLGKIDVVILSHAHGDHIGDLKLKALESGDPASKHYGDLLGDWAAGRYHPMVYSRKAVEAAMEERIILQP